MNTGQTRSTKAGYAPRPSRGPIPQAPAVPPSASLRTLPAPPVTRQPSPPQKAVTFTPEQLVVYPAQGVGVIERVERQEIGGMAAEFYVIRIVAGNIRVMVPVKNALTVGLRTLCSTAEAEAVLTSLQDRGTFSGYTGQNWNRRYREYSERLKSSSLLDVGYVLKELILISGEKELSFGERRLQEQAMGLIACELAHVLQREMEDIKAEIESYYADITAKSEKKP